MLPYSSAASAADGERAAPAAKERPERMARRFKACGMELRAIADGGSATVAPATMPIMVLGVYKARRSVPTNTSADDNQPITDVGDRARCDSTEQRVTGIIRPRQTGSAHIGLLHALAFPLSRSTVYYFAFFACARRHRPTAAPRGFTSFILRQQTLGSRGTPEQTRARSRPGAACRCVDQWVRWGRRRLVAPRSAACPRRGPY